MSTFDAGPFENGAAILLERDARGRLRWAIFDAAGGDPVRRVYDRDQAIAFAQGLPGPEALGLEPILPPSPINLSHRAKARAKELGIDVPEPVPEPTDGAQSTSMSEARARSCVGPSHRQVKIQLRPRMPT